MNDLIFEELPLIGWKAQRKLAPSYRKEAYTSEELMQFQPREASVLCVWFPRNGEWVFPLMKRMPYEGVHSHQISFPGGAIEDSDRDAYAAALRETEEELGMKISRESDFIELSDLYIPPSNFLVHPFMVRTHQDWVFTKDPVEVEEIFLISLEELFKAPILFKESRGNEIPYFELAGEVVWGATAMILSEIKEILFISLSDTEGK